MDSDRETYMKRQEQDHDLLRMRNPDRPYRGVEKVSERIAALEAEVARLREALTPSGATKAAYIGEFSFEIEIEIKGGKVYVPWTTVKEIMAAILNRATTP